MPPPLLAFGHAALAQRIVAELVDSLQPGAGNSTEPALVVGVFGEWGAGKSRLLQHVGDELATHGQQGGEQALTVVVPFNAWRYEREEHLLVPLLRVAQQCLRKALEDSVGADIRHNETLSDRFALLGDLAQTVYEHGGRQLLQTALAAQGVVLKLPALKAEAGKAQPSAWARWREHREALKQARRLALPADSLNSLYYDFLEHLKAVTGRNPKALAQHRARLKYRGLGWWPRLKWRARASLGWLATGELPAEADFRLNLVFLVDDLDRCLPDKAVEVLEAIKLFLEVEGCAFVLALDEEVIERGIAHRYRDYALQGREGLTPITGAEYLEKLVHLPVRLPRPTGAAARDFLALRWPDWFGDPSTGEPNELATLVAAITPGVPRKLHRMASLLALAESLGAGDAKTPRRREWLAIVCALQLFAPALYRFLRLHGARLLITLSQWRADALFRDADGLRQALQARVHGVTSPVELQYWLVLQRLPALCEAVMHNRSGFDLLELLARVSELQEKAELKGAQLGALLVFAEAEVESLTDPTEGEIPQAAATSELSDGIQIGSVLVSGSLYSPQPEAKLENERALIEAVKSGELELVRVALSREGAALRGSVLPARLWEEIKVGLIAPEPENLIANSALGDEMLPLLHELKPHLSQAAALDLLRIYGEPIRTVLNRPDWAQRVTNTESLELLAPPLLLGIDVYLRTVNMEAAATWRIPRGWKAAEWRRPGGVGEVIITVSSDEIYGVSAELKMMSAIGLESPVQRLRWVPQGAFAMGSVNGPTEDGRLGTASLSRGFWIADTTCSRALWRWLTGLSSPKYDGDLPITDVSAAEVEQVLEQLEEKLDGCKICLPSEAEWEAACRAGTRTAYAFGDEVTHDQVNAEATSLLPVSSLAPNSWGLFQMHGNVEELCRDFLGPDHSSNDGQDLEGLLGSSTSLHALRGGSFRTSFQRARSDSLQRIGRDERRDDVGFRFIVRAKPAPDAEPA